MKMTTLILLMGLPRTGKTTFSKTLNAVRIEIEQLRIGATGEPSPNENYDDLVRNITQRSVHFYLNQNKDVVVDDLFLTAVERKVFITIAKKMNANVLLYWFDPPLDVIIEKYNSSNTEYTDKEFFSSKIKKMSKNIDLPNVSEGIDKIYYLN
jgi:predicted kinase